MSWKYVPFDQLFIDRTGGNKKLKQSEFLDDGELPIVDQGQTFIAGYTNDEVARCNVALPCIIFGDHTRIFKFIDFPFALGADGVKVLEPKRDLYALYGYFYLNQVKLAGKEGYQRNYKYLKDLNIPLPPLPIQKKIACILEKADKAREKRRQANQLTEEFLQSAFLEMFGDPGINAKRLHSKRLADLVRMDDKINYGVVQPGDDYPGGVPIVRVGDFEGMHINKKNLKRIDPKIEVAYKRSRLVGDEVLLACVGSIGMVALADPNVEGFNTVRAVARIRCGKDLNRIFLAFYLLSSFSQSFFRRETRTVSQPTLNIKQIEDTPILLPPMKQQQNFATLVEKTDTLRAKQKESEAELENLFQSLMQRAFKGELVG